MAGADLTSRPVSPTEALQTLVSQLQAAASRAAADGPATHDGAASTSDPDAVANVEASLQSILAAVGMHAAQANVAEAETPPWQVAPAVAGPTGPVVTLSSLGKRQREETTEAEEQTKMRRLQPVPDAGCGHQMTTVVCLHAAVAQKSYSTEKRFLCPPPVVHVEGSAASHMKNQHLSMSVVSETGERSFDQKSVLDMNMEANFKFLHVTGTGKAKNFYLSLDISEPPAGSGAFDEQAPGGRTWASFDSASVAIISKPSKKTAKTRNISACILAGAPVSLFNRINSQTVRTKYMAIENSQLCASNIKWSAFTVNLARRETDEPLMAGQTAVTYGSEIILTDATSGISTAPLIVRKVDKGRVVHDDGGPVSQMQKIALQRMNPDGTRHYLSASGLESSSTASLPTPDKSTASSNTHPLLFMSSHLREESRDGVRTVVDELDDALCWTIVGISKFQYTFFDAFQQGAPKLSITPFPALCSVPLFRPQTNTMELTAANFFYKDPHTQALTPLQVYLGKLGPLPARVYQSPPSVTDSGSQVPQRFGSLGSDHSIIMVDLPEMKDVMKAVSDQISADVDPPVAPSDGLSNSLGLDAANRLGMQQDKPLLPSQELVGRSLPLLFVRGCDGVGYHTGRSAVLENVLAQFDFPQTSSGMDGNWLSAAPQAMSTEISAWTLRVM